MLDHLYRFTFERAALRGEIVVLERGWRSVIDRHAYAPAVIQYLGQALAAVTLLSGTIKFKGSLILQLQGKGPLGTLVAQATEHRQYRGMAHATARVPSGDLAAALGDGRLVLTAESPQGERYQGITAIEGRSLAGSIESYFRDSEQLASHVWLAADERRAAGLFLQRLPVDGDAEVSATDAEEDRSRVCMLARTVTAPELLGLDPEELIRRLFHEETVRLYDPEPATFRCGCSRDRIASVLRGMGRAEVESILEQRGQVDIDCEFCNAHYVFDPIDARALFAEGAVSPPARTQ